MLCCRAYFIIPSLLIYIFLPQNKKCRSCQVSLSFMNTCALHSIVEKTPRSLNPTRTQPSLCRKHPASLFHCTLMQQEKEQNLSIDLCKGRHLGNAHTGSYISIHSAICMSVRKLESWCFNTRFYLEVRGLILPIYFCAALK